jgi:hypothetical protein
MRSLSDVLDQERVVRANRAASLTDPVVYVVNDDLEVVEHAFIKTTPKYVKFDTGRRMGTRPDSPPWYAYADLVQFNAGEAARVIGGGFGGWIHMYYAWRDRAGAEAHAETWRRWREQHRAGRTA